MAVYGFLEGSSDPQSEAFYCFVIIMVPGSERSSTITAENKNSLRRNLLTPDNVRFVTRWLLRAVVSVCLEAFSAFAGAGAVACAASGAFAISMPESNVGASAEISSAEGVIFASLSDTIEFELEVSWPIGNLSRVDCDHWPALFLSTHKTSFRLINPCGLVSLPYALSTRTLSMLIPFFV